MLSISILSRKLQLECLLSSNLVEDIEERPAKQARITTHAGTKGAKSDIRGVRKVLPSRRSRIKDRMATTKVPREVTTGKHTRYVCTNQHSIYQTSSTLSTPRTARSHYGRTLE